jgi:hypothetical protein
MEAHWRCCDNGNDLPFNIAMHTLSCVSIPTPSPQVNGRTTDDFLVSFGGKTTDKRPNGLSVEKYQFTNQMFAFDLRLNRWISCVVPSRDSPRPRGYHGAAAHWNTLYVVGGLASNPASMENDVEVLRDVWRCTFSLSCASDFRDPDASQGLLECRWELLSNEGPGFCYHTTTLHTILSRPYLLCYGGHDYRHDLLDVVYLFDIENAQWLDPILPTPLTDWRLLTGGGGNGDQQENDAGLPRGGAALPATLCPHCGSRNLFCAHQSTTLRSRHIQSRQVSRRVLCSLSRGAESVSDAIAHSSPRSNVEPSMPPRCGHSAISVFPVRPSHSCEIEVLLFGGEIARTLFNSLLSIRISFSRPSSPTPLQPPRLECGDARWCALAGGHEFHAVQKQSPPRMLALHESSDEAESSPTSDSNDPLSDSTPSPSVADSSITCVIRTSLSPDDTFTEAADQSTLLGPEHRAFAAAWSTGSTGALIYGGFRREKCLSSAWYFDRIRQRWQTVRNVVVIDASTTIHRFGPRGCSGAATRLRCSNAVCDECGAPLEEDHFLFGGENDSGLLCSDLWVFQLHYVGCRGRARDRSFQKVLFNPELTPPAKPRPPQRSERFQCPHPPPLWNLEYPSSNDYDQRLALMGDASESACGGDESTSLVLLPLKLIVGMYILDRLDAFGRTLHKTRRAGK